METPTFHLEKVIKSKEEYEDFEGPLDLILFLLSRNKIEIKDIKIAEILDQYLEYLGEMEKLDLEIASEFVAMASHLLYLKTRMLLSIDDSEVNEEMENLIKSLEERSRMIEYQNMRLGVEYLSERADVGRDIFVKNPQPIEIDKTYPYTHDPEELPEAILQIKKRTRRKLPPPVSSFHGIVGKEAFPVSVKITELLQQFIFRPVAKLKQLIVGCKSRSEIVATFLAVLELCKGKKAHIRSDAEDYEICYVSGEDDESIM
ncbi:MAG: segregation and condensation protein A [Eubacteriales bacterium]|jgi:segregation and condensation protein A